ncbi:MAG TPA: ProQ/FINO family protein, partial [Paraburkholderia sp.]|nr:ProQ/FINO family protein [Paraburkholderia sp.]
MKAASQQRRTLSFKDGLLEIKKSMGLGTEQPPEEQTQSPQGRHAPKQTQTGAKTGSQKGAQGQRRAQGAPGPKGPKGPRPGGGSDEARSRARPQQRGEAQGKPAGETAGTGKTGDQRHGAKGQQSRPSRGPRDGERGAQRQRPARPQPSMANLSEAEKARIERNRQLNAVWNVFAKHYPAFRERLPLKIGVVEDLVARHPDYERTLIVAVLKRHVNHPRYHERVAEGGPRYELDGSASEGPGIEPSHIGRAKAALAHQKAKAEARAKEQEAGKAGQAPAAAPAAAETATPAQDPAAAQPAEHAAAAPQEQAEPAQPEQAPAATSESPGNDGGAPTTQG